MLGLRTQTRDRTVGFVADVCAQCYAVVKTAVMVSEERFVILVVFPMSPWISSKVYAACCRCGSHRPCRIKDFSERLPPECANDLDELLARTNPLLCDFVINCGDDFDRQVSTELSSDQRRAALAYALYELDRQHFVRHPSGGRPQLVVIWPVLSVVCMISLFCIINPVSKPGSPAWLIATMMLCSGAVISGVVVFLGAKWLRKRRSRPFLRMFQESAAAMGASPAETAACMEMGRDQGWDVAKAA